MEASAHRNPKQRNGPSGGGVLYGTRCPVRDKADHISRTHKKGDCAREHLAERSPNRLPPPCPEPSGFRLRDASPRFMPSSLRLVGRRKSRGSALFAEQCRHHCALGWTEPQRPKWLEVQEETPRTDDSEHEITDEERKAFCEQMRRLRASLQRPTSNEQ
jgi:hypothetical protein